MISNVDLNSKFEDTFSNIDRKKWHYLHKESVTNFIYHINNIDNERTRDEISKVIGNYLDYINNLREDILDIDISLSRFLFDNYIKKIQEIYVKDLGFIYIPSIRTIAFMLPFFIAVLYFVKFKTVVILSSVIAICIYIVFILYKNKKKKLYGFDY